MCSCRKDSFITHRAFCDALAEESARLMSAAVTTSPPLHQPLYLPFSSWHPTTSSNPNLILNPSHDPDLGALQIKPAENDLSTLVHHLPTSTSASAHLSATALLQRASTMGAMSFTNTVSGQGYDGMMAGDVAAFPMWQNGHRLTRDFLGVAAGEVGEDDDDDLLLDLVTASSCAPMGDPTKQLSGFPPVTGPHGEHPRHKLLLSEIMFTVSIFSAAIEHKAWRLQEKLERKKTGGTGVGIDVWREGEKRVA
ncbi:hypothetical protein BHE74_00002500 [Ensete ventricosum]|nr:hypothetical protein BHE74_00002500 [Ensete ventricosum]